jgi:Spy/CpxP family protein refolding chaperone
MKRGWLASLLAAAVVLPMAARGADETKTLETTPAKAPSNSSDATTTKAAKGRLPQYYGKLPVTSDQRQKIYEIEASFAPKIKELREQLEKLEAEQSEQFKAVLTPEQQEKLKTMMAESKGKRHGRAPADVAPKPAETNKTTPPTSATTTPTPVQK